VNLGEGTPENRLRHFFVLNRHFSVALFAVCLLLCEGVLTGSSAGGTAANNKSLLSGGNPETASNLVVSVAYRMGASYRSPDKDLKWSRRRLCFGKKLLQVSGVEVCQKAASNWQLALCFSFTHSFYSIKHLYFGKAKPHRHERLCHKGKGIAGEGQEAASN
jgi:hypothetical protein